MLSVSLSVGGGGRPQAQGREGGGGQLGVAVPVPHVTASGLLDVHPQPVDLPAGGGEVALQLELPFSQSENREIINNYQTIVTSMNAGEKARLT